MTPLPRIKTLEEVKVCLRLLSEAGDERLQEAAASGELTECLAVLWNQSEFKAVPAGQPYPVAQFGVFAGHDNVETAIALLLRSDFKQAKTKIQVAWQALLRTKQREPTE